MCDTKRLEWSLWLAVCREFGHVAGKAEALGEWRFYYDDALDEFRDSPDGLGMFVARSSHSPQELLTVMVAAARSSNILS